MLKRKDAKDMFPDEAFEFGRKRIFNILKENYNEILRIVHRSNDAETKKKDKITNILIDIEESQRLIEEWPIGFDENFHRKEIWEMFEMGIGLSIEEIISFLFSKEVS